MNEKTLNNMIHTYLEKYPPSLKLFCMLEKAGDIYLIGGVLREFKDNGNIIDLRDIDIVIDIKDERQWKSILSEFYTKQNRFGGYKLLCSGLIVDVWRLEETWAYKNHIIECEAEKYVEHLADTVFLNIDAIVYDLKNDLWYDKKYSEAMNSRVLDIVLERNPEIPLNIVRAMVLKQRYDMSYSIKMKNVILKEKENEKDFLNRLMDIQLVRYRKEILSCSYIQKELNQLIV